MDISLVLGIVNIFLILVIIGVILFLTYARIVLKKDMEKLQSTSSNTSITAPTTSNTPTTSNIPTNTISTTPITSTTNNTSTSAPKNNNVSATFPMCCKDIDSSIFYKNDLKSCVQGKFNCPILGEELCNTRKSSCIWTSDKGCIEKPNAIENYVIAVDMSLCDKNTNTLYVNLI